MTTSKNDEVYLSTQTSINSKATADVHSLLNSFSMNSTHERKRSRTICQPHGTIPYTVEENDTVEKVALRFNSTPSELLQLNKLNTRIVFPGQILFVPEECPADNSNEQQLTTSPPPPHEISSSALPKPKDSDALTDHHLSGEFSSPSLPSLQHQSQQDIGPMVWSMVRQTTAKPGRAHRLQSDTSTENEPPPPPKMMEERLSTQSDDSSKQARKLQRNLSIELDGECLQRFIKANARLITEDHQSVAGTLLVTPNAVMFDPDVLDPLIKEYGIEKYGLIIRMDLLAGIALYEDLAMYEHEATVRDEEKRKMCHSISVKNLQHNHPNTPLNTDEEQIHDLIISLLDKIDKELNPPISTDTCCMLFNASSTIQRHISKTFSDNNNNDNETFLPILTDEVSLDNSLELSNDLFEPLDDYKHSIGILRSDDENENKNFNRVPSQGCHLENCVSLDQFNKRFVEIDKLLYKQQQNYLTPHPIVIPYYLCFKTSIHIDDIPSLYAKEYKNTNNIYGTKQLECEYWFSVSKEKIDLLYSFFLRWTPERELNPLIDDDDDDQSLNNARIKLNDKTPNKGFVLLATADPELTDEYFTKKISKNKKNKNEEQKKIHYLKKQNSLVKEWEVRLKNF